MKDLYRPKSRPEFPRSYVPKSIDLGVWPSIEPLFLELEKRDLSTTAALEQWIADWGELGDVLSEEYSRRHIAHSRFTDDKRLEAAYKYYVENIIPQLKIHNKNLEDRFLASPARKKLPRARYKIYERNLAASADLFRKENVSLQTRASQLEIDYGKICGAMMVRFQGKKWTLQQMAVFLEETNRATREKAWRIIADRRFQDRSRIDGLFDRLLKLRRRIAENAGKPGYEEYAFQSYLRFDYTPMDCEEFGRSVERCAVPMNRALEERRARKLGLQQLRPWDYAVDVEGRPPLRPCEKSDEFVPLAIKMFKRVDPQLANYIRDMDRKGLFDLDSRKGKRPGGFMSDLAEVRLPFIFMNAAGLHRDLETILHEAGHAFHLYESRLLEISRYRSEVPMEFAEVASMSMELVAGEHYHVVYGEKDAARARRKTLEGILGVLPWIATIDGFQRWIYRNPGHTRAERTAQWLQLDRRFGMRPDWSGIEKYRQSSWQRQLHIFHYPFYYIEYGIAQLGALQVWANYKKDPKQAMAMYRHALSLGGSRPLPELFKAAGIRFDFSEKTIRPLMNLVSRELAELDEK